MIFIEDIKMKENLGCSFEEYMSQSYERDDKHGHWFGSTEIIVFTDQSMTGDQLCNASDYWLPNPDLVKRVRYPYTLEPIIEYSFSYRNKEFKAKCTICNREIHEAWGATPDIDETGNHMGTWEGGLRFEDALKKNSEKQGAWTCDGLLLCSICLYLNEKEKLYSIKRAFKFEGDIPESRSRYYSHDRISYDRTSPKTFALYKLLEKVLSKNQKKNF